MRTIRKVPDPDPAVLRTALARLENEGDSMPLGASISSAAAVRRRSAPGGRGRARYVVPSGRYAFDNYRIDPYDDMGGMGMYDDESMYGDSDSDGDNPSSQECVIS